MDKATTKKGLKVFANILDRVYHTGKKVEENFKKNMPIVYHDVLPQWDYRAVPSN